MTTDTVNDESSVPVKLGAGSFASVYVIRGGIVAYKVVAQVGDTAAAELQKEYETLNSVYVSCNADSFFSIPRAFAFKDLTLGFLTSSPNPVFSNGRRSCPERPFVTESMFSVFHRATYAMDRVHAIPHDAGLKISHQYFPKVLADKGVALCRLYFGKNYDHDSNACVPRFINTDNFPLDEYRYNRLRDIYTDDSFLELVSDVTAGMGQMLSKLHYKARCDARDVEFVLGGTGAAGFSYYVIDYNQVRPWTEPSDVGPLVSAFFDNDPYYPRPIQGNRLYTAFRAGYLKATTEDDKATAMSFLKAIEQEQQERQSRRTTS